MILVMASDYDNIKEELPKCMEVKEENIKGTKVYFLKDVINKQVTKSIKY